MGDGDCLAIGGNHLIHAARRNMDLTALVFNNSIYGMTGGQMSPTTFAGDLSTTSVYGNIEPAFDICELARAAGATYVARGTSWGYQQLVSLMAGGIVHKGFSFVEAKVSCPTYYGRQNKGGAPAQMLKRQHERGVPVERFEDGAARFKERYPVGVLHHVERRVHRGLRRRAARARESGVLSRRSQGRVEVRLSGSGGQGIILAAALLADACAEAGKEVVQTQSYGPEARGGASKAEVMVAD